MAHPIKEMARLTTRTKQIDGMGFGGVAADNLEVAGALGMKSPINGRKLPRQQYSLARYLFVDDRSQGFAVKASLLEIANKMDTGKISKITLLKMVSAALREYQSPATKINNKTGEQEVVAYSGREIAKNIGINHKSLTARHEDIYAEVLNTIHVWASEAVSHVRSHIEQIAA